MVQLFCPLTSADVGLTFEDLSRRVDQVAAGLIELGIESGDIVAVQLPNWVESVESALACARIGAIICPLNPGLRTEIAYILNVTGARMWLAPESYRDFEYRQLLEQVRPDLADPPTFVSVRSEGEAELPFEAFYERATGVGKPAGEIDANDPWEIFFTSGTTSDPKGVVRTHNNTLATLRNFADYFELIKPGTGEVFLAVLPVSFIFCFYFSVMNPLTNGTPVVLQDRFDAEETLSLIEKFGITHMPLVPSMIDSIS